jgi:NhaP-type Na+/H+ or K+/H+ antiporter
MTHRSLPVIVALSATLVPELARGQPLLRDARFADSTAVVAGFARLDSTLRAQPRHALVGAVVGTVAGAALGYGLARLGHRAFCEGGAQCADYPRRAVRESVVGGAIVGALAGSAVGWLTFVVRDRAPPSRPLNER